MMGLPVDQNLIQFTVNIGGKNQDFFRVTQQLARNVESEFALVLGSNTSTIIRTWAGWGDPNSVDRFIGTELKGFTRLFTIIDLSQTTTSSEC